MCVSLCRVINAGKSHHNEDQACCEFVTVEEREGRSNNNCNESQPSDVQDDAKVCKGTDPSHINSLATITLRLETL